MKMIIKECNIIKRQRKTILRKEKYITFSTVAKVKVRWGNKRPLYLASRR